MNSKHKNRIAICGGCMAVSLLLAGMTMPQPAKTPQTHKTATTVAPQIRPVCDFVPRGMDVPAPVNQTTGVEPVSPESSTLTPPTLDTTPELKVIAEPEELRTPIPPPTTQEQTISTPSAEPQMGDTRILDGQKQVYFLGFGWIEDNDTSNEGVYVEDMYENGNKVGSMGGGTFVDGDGDINKMVGTMGGGEVGRSCGDINKMVGIMD